MDLNRLAQELERERRRDLNAQARERRDYEQMGLDYSQILAARSGAFSEALRRAEELRRAPVQLELQGVMPSLLEQLRYRGAMDPVEAATAGVYGVGWQPTPQYPGRQMTLEEILPANGVRSVPPEVIAAAVQEPEVIAALVKNPEIAAAAAEEAAAQQPAKGRSGRRMAMRWGLPIAGGGLGLYALLAAGGGEATPMEE